MLYNQQKLQQVFNEAQILTKRYTKSLTLLNLIELRQLKLESLTKQFLLLEEHFQLSQMMPKLTIIWAMR